MPICQPQLKSTERRSRASAAGTYGGAPPPRPPRPPPPPPCAPAGGAPAGPAPWPPCALAVSGALSINTSPSAIVVRVITNLLSSAQCLPERLNGVPWAALSVG